MLVLSRKESERVVINENIVITIVRVAGGGVRIGIEAPREIPIRREELAAYRDGESTDQTTACLRRRNDCRDVCADLGV